MKPRSVHQYGTLFSLPLRYRNALDIRSCLDISEDHFNESSAHEIFLNLLARIPCAEALHKSDDLDAVQSIPRGAESPDAEIIFFSKQAPAFLR
jgi:hypothetical protein